MPIEKIIVLEDDAIIRRNLEQILRGRGYTVASAITLATAREYLGKDNFDLVLADVKLPDGEGTDLLCQLQGRPQRPEVIMMSGFGTVESAVECMRNGAFDYLIKPFSAEQLEVTLKKLEDYTQIVKVNQYFSHSGDDATSELIGKSQSMERLRQLIRKVARTQATVLIQGESGTGKELAARAIYNQSARSGAAFITVNCAAVPENLIESEFFGHEKGAFTGAMNKREGRFELAHGGTILLDEISEISPQVQAKLLRVLQERELQRVGGNRTLKVDVRVIATTNRNLQESVAKREFREDLFFRLNVVPIVIPPLRERMEDLPLLAEDFLHRFARKHGVNILGISPRGMAALQNYQWPGNVRELQNVIERAVILCPDGGTLGPQHFGLNPGDPIVVETKDTAASGVAPDAEAPVSAAGQACGVESFVSPPRDSAPIFPEEHAAKAAIPTLWELERRLITTALERCQDNRTHAAKLIGVSLRTLRNKLAEYRALEGAHNRLNEPEQARKVTY